MANPRAHGDVKSFAGTLIEELRCLVQGMDELLDVSTINYVPRRAERESLDGVLVVVPDGMWGRLDDRQRAHQRSLLQRWNPWSEKMSLLLAEDTERRRRELSETAKRVRGWIERNAMTFDLPPTISEAKQIFGRCVKPLFDILQSMNTPARTVAVPDTNVLIRNPEIATYSSALCTDAFTVLLVPGVLAEVDEHKVNHRNENVRERARKISSRIKGWRNQGPLAEGVTVQGDIVVQVEGREPDFSRTLSWLQAEVVDDRIIASVLDFQRRYPSDRVVLLSGDAIMLAKADLASIPTADTPDPEV